MYQRSHGCKVINQYAKGTFTSATLVYLRWSLSASCLSITQHWFCCG